MPAQILNLETFRSDRADPMDLDRVIDRVLDRGSRGEHALVLAVLEDAIALFIKDCPDAENWIFGEPMNGAEHNVSFINAADQLQVFCDDGEILDYDRPARKLDLFGTSAQSIGFNIDDVAAYINIPLAVLRKNIMRKKEARKDKARQLNFYTGGSRR